MDGSPPFTTVQMWRILHSWRRTHSADEDGILMFSGPVEFGQHCFSGQIRDAHPDFLPGGPSVCRNKPVGPPGKKSGWTSRIWRLKQCWPSSRKPLNRKRLPNCGRMWNFQVPHLVLMQGWFDELLLCSMWSFNRWGLYFVRAKSAVSQSADLPACKAPQQTDARIVQGWLILRLVQEAIHARSVFHELIEESAAQCHPAPNVKCKGTVHY